MENGPFIDGLPIKKGGFSMAMLDNQMVVLESHAYFMNFKTSRYSQVNPRHKNAWLNPQLI